MNCFSSIALLILLLAPTETLSQTKRVAAKDSIVGCYSDVKTISGGGLIVGSGAIIIKKQGDEYSGTFRQLKDDGGEGYRAVPLEKLLVNKTKLTLSFNVRLFYVDEYGKLAERISQVSGRVSDKGLQLVWKDDALIYGRPNPLMKRSNDCGE